MKMLSENHIVVEFQIDHPAFGFLRIGSCQRTRKDVDNALLLKKIVYKGMELPVVGNSEIIDNLNKCVSQVCVIVPWNLDFTKSQQHENRHELIADLAYIEIYAKELRENLISGTDNGNAVFAERIGKLAETVRASIK